jgi:hypothetical protein
MPVFLIGNKWHNNVMAKGKEPRKKGQKFTHPFALISKGRRRSQRMKPEAIYLLLSPKNIPLSANNPKNNSISLRHHSIHQHHPN